MERKISVKTKLFSSLTSLKGLFFMTLLILSSLFSISYLVGFSKVSISGFTLLAPIIGFMGSAHIALIFIIGKVFFKYLSSMSISLLPITFYIPTVGSMLYSSYSVIWLRTGLPLMCIAFFIMHPVGYGAAPYVLFWLIPICCAFLSKQHVFWTMLGSIFTAHALGSVLWLYQVPMTSQQFLALIPIVFVERLIMASMMTVLYFAFKNLYMIFSPSSPFSKKIALKHS